MSNSEKANSPDSSRLSRQVERLFEQYFADPGSPRMEEVRQMTQDILLRNAELENKVGNLKTITQQLKEYRDRYVDLYELAPVGYATLDEEAYVQEINLAGSELLGCNRDELIGYSLVSHVRLRDQEDFLKQINRCCCDHHVLTFEAGMVTKDGKTITVQIRGVPIESLENEATFCKIAITDISERKATERAIRASEANYRAIFDTANDAIFIHDAETGAILDINQKAVEMYGYAPEEMRELSVEAISEGTPDYSQEEALRRLKQAGAGSPQLFTWRCKDKSGRLFWAEVNIKRTVLGGMPRLLAIVRDITGRKELD
jgi:PAS domain S-box-containing protein